MFIEQYGQLFNIGQAGQSAMRQVIDVALRRIERDSAGVPIKLYPFTRSGLKDTPRTIVIDPRLSAGHPVMAGGGLATQPHVIQRIQPMGGLINERGERILI